MCRYKYDKTFEILKQRIDPLASEYQACIQRLGQGINPQLAGEVAVIEGQLAWLIYCIGSIISSTMGSSTEDKTVALHIDAKLSACVFKMIRFVDFRLNNPVMFELV